MLQIEYDGFHTMLYLNERQVLFGVLWNSPVTFDADLPWTQHVYINIVQYHEQEVEFYLNMI